MLVVGLKRKLAAVVDGILPMFTGEVWLVGIWWDELKEEVLSTLILYVNISEPSWDSTTWANVREESQNVSPPFSNLIEK